MILRLLLLLTAACALFGQDDAASRIDRLFKQWSSTTAPGASVAVIRDGQLLFSKGYGAASLEYNVPITAETIFHVAFVSKQFTAMALVLLEQDKRLSLEDDIRKYLPELPDYGHKIAIRNLLQHTSGIRDQWQTLALAGWRLDDVITQEQILRMLFRQKELNFEPGARHLYSNGGYTLAAEIVARVSGKPFPDFCKERIFQPLGMTHTHFHIDHEEIVPNRAYSYHWIAGSFKDSALNYANAGATSLFTTAPDLVKWLDNFRDPKVGGPAAMNRLEEQAVLNDGKKIDYALGLATGTYRGLKTISHGGADAGYRSEVLWFPGQRFGVAVLSNLASFDPGDLASKVAEIYLEHEMTPVEPSKTTARTYIVPDPASLDQYVGQYYLDNGVVEVVKQGGKLFASPAGQKKLELKPVAPGKFFVEEMKVDVEFVRGPDRKLVLKVMQGGNTMTGDRVSETPSVPKDFADYAGVYWSDELETQYTVVAKDEKLTAVHIRHGNIDLKPVAGDEFSGSMWFIQEVKFLRDASRKITGMQVGGGRVSAIKFVRRPAA